MSYHLNVNRRRFLGLAGGLGAASLLAGCGSGGAGGTATVRAIMPGTTPVGWNTVLAEVNKRLRKDRGISLDIQFINWSNYGQQALLKFTAGEKFDTALQALWLNMAQLQKSSALADLTHEWSKYPHLKSQLAAKLISSNSWNGHLWGIPQVNSAGRIQHFSIRQDLAEKYGFADLGFPNFPAYDRLEKFLYTVKQKGGGIIPYGAASNSTDLFAIPVPTGMFNVANWADPHTIAFAFTGKGLFFIPAKNAAQTRSVNPIPFWEDPGVVDTFHRIRKYYQDGIINHDAISADLATVASKWAAGQYAATWAITDGTASNVLPQMQQAIPGAQLAEVFPLKDGMNAKPNQTFQADNLVVVPAKGGNIAHALELEDWLSIKENHDLISYGITGKDWQPVGDSQFKALSKYAFNGFALCWRQKLERQASYQTESEAKAFAWAQNYDNFTVDPFHSFIPDDTPVKNAVAQMTSVMTQYANPLYYGVVDVNSQLNKLKKAAAGAGLDKLQAEMDKQANAYLANS